jgi:membrane-bound ClpP family serine protease
MGISVSYWLIAILILFFGTVVFLIGKLVIKDLKKKSLTGAEGLIEETGIVLEWNDEKKTGKARIHGEIWTIKSSDTLKEDDRIKVVDMQDFTLMVRRIE